nr:NAD(P)/FAD-dependent oxidoreductase [Rhodococcus wratislaviensis]GLK35104.1 steroid monooxygenase [Rhodococcus wratislaviensis]
MSVNTTVDDVAKVDHEVIIIGAGFSGLGTLYYARQAGIDVTLLEAGAGVGGTWFWNRYPGACTDTEFWSYAFSFAKEELSEWRWSTRFPVQQEVEGYLNFVADRLDLRQHIRLSTRVSSLRYNESSNLWSVTTSAGDVLHARYVVTAVGGLSKPTLPDIPGLESFAGEVLLSARWPKTPVDFAGKRIALFGTASTGVQILPEAAPNAEDVYVLQRTPNFVLPKHNREIDDAQRQRVAANHDEIWRNTSKHFFAFPLPAPLGASSDFTEEERDKVFEEKWTEGGFGFSFSTFDDIDTSEEGNDYAAEFIRRKIRETVADPETAELLTPKNYPYGAKRPPVGDGYYESFNRENVHLVDISKDPIEATPTSLKVGDRDLEVDMIVFATGFDAMTGALNAIEIIGEDGQRLSERWNEGVRTHTGIATEGFPNLFFVYGPQTPHANIPPVVQRAGQFAIHAITHLHENDLDYFEAESDAMEAWHDRLHEAAEGVLITRNPSESKAWFLGANVHGKRVDVLVYLGGAHNYLATLDELEANEYPGFVLQQRAAEATASAVAR